MGCSGGGGEAPPRGVREWISYYAINGLNCKGAAQASSTSLHAGTQAEHLLDSIVVELDPLMVLYLSLVVALVVSLQLQHHAALAT